MSAPEACEHIRIFPVLVGSCGIPFPAFFHHSGKVRIPGKEPFHLFLRRAVRSFRADELGIEERIDPVRLRALYDGIEECGGICAIPILKSSFARYFRTVFRSIPSASAIPLMLFPESHASFMLSIWDILSISSSSPCFFFFSSKKYISRTPA